MRDDYYYYTLSMSFISPFPMKRGSTNEDLIESFFSLQQIRSLLTRQLNFILLHALSALLPNVLHHNPILYISKIIITSRKSCIVAKVSTFLPFLATSVSRKSLLFYHYGFYSVTWNFPIAFSFLPLQMIVTPSPRFTFLCPFIL